MGSPSDNQMKMDIGLLLINQHINEESFQKLLKCSGATANTGKAC